MVAYIDPDILLAGRNIPFPDPLEMATRGATFAGLMNKVQGGDIELAQQMQMMKMAQDPRYAAAFTGGGAGGASPDLAGLMQDYPMAAPTFLNQVLGAREKGAQITKNLADADEASRKAQLSKMQTVGNYAARLVMQGNNVTPTDFMNVVYGLNDAGIDPRRFGSVPDLRNASTYDLQQFMRNVATISADPAALSKIITEQTTLQPTVRKLTAEAAQSEETTREMPAELAVKQGNLGVAQYNAFTTRNMPTAVKNVLGQQEVFSPWQAAFGGGGPPGPYAPSVRPPATPPANAPQMGGTGGATGSEARNTPPTPTDKGPSTIPDVGQASVPGGTVAPGGARAVIGASGQPLQLEPNPAQKSNIDAAQKNLDDLNARVASAQQMRQLAIDMRNKEYAPGGIITGVMATQGVQRFLTQISPMLSQDLQQRIANTQDWQAQGGQLIADAVRQFAGARIAAREIDFFKTVKPETWQTPAGREQIYQNLITLSDRLTQYRDQAADYMDKNPLAGLSKFTPQFTEPEIPPIMVLAPNGRKYPAANANDARSMQQEFADRSIMPER